jgi:hypothetical protein
MSGLRNNLVLLGIGVARSQDGAKEYYCFTARFRPKVFLREEPEVENMRRALRDLGRAMESFVLGADLEGPSWNEIRRSAQGPFALPDGKEHFGNIVFVPSSTEDPDVISRHIRAGLNAAAALLRATGYYRVSIRYKPEEQLPLKDVSGDTSKEDEEELPV